MFFLLLSCADYGFQVDNEIVVSGTYNQLQGQVVASKLDLLLIVDASCSMVDGEHQYLRDAMPDVLDDFSNEFVDLSWRAGITATDPSAGILGVVDGDDPLADHKLRSLPSMLEAEYAGEAGLDAAVLSMLWDPEFHRPDASLQIVLISDEDSQGVENADSYLDVARDYKEPPYVVSTVSIVMLDSYSPLASCGGEIGFEYIAAAADGLALSLCQPSTWSRMIEPMHDAVPVASGLAWVLDPPPINLAQVWVTVDGEPVDSWEWQPPTLRLTEAPKPGSWIVVSWESEP